MSRHSLGSSEPQPAAPLGNPPQPVYQRARGGHNLSRASMLEKVQSTLVQGKAIDFAFDPRTPSAPMSDYNSCDIYFKSYIECLDNYKTEYSNCKNYIRKLNECRMKADASST